MFKRIIKATDRIILRLFIERGLFYVWLAFTLLNSGWLYFDNFYPFIDEADKLERAAYFMKYLIEGEYRVILTLFGSQPPLLPIMGAPFLYYLGETATISFTGSLALFLWITGIRRLAAMVGDEKQAFIAAFIGGTAAFPVFFMRIFDVELTQAGFLIWCYIYLIKSQGFLLRKETVLCALFGGLSTLAKWATPIYLLVPTIFIFIFKRPKEKTAAKLFWKNIAISGAVYLTMVLPSNIIFAYVLLELKKDGTLKEVRNTIYALLSEQSVNPLLIFLLILTIYFLAILLNGTVGFLFYYYLLKKENRGFLNPLNAFRRYSSSDEPPDQAKLILYLWGVGSLIILTLIPHRHPFLILPLMPPLLIFTAVKIFAWLDNNSKRKAVLFLGIALQSILLFISPVPLKYNPLHQEGEWNKFVMRLYPIDEDWKISEILQDICGQIEKEKLGTIRKKAKICVRTHNIPMNIHTFQYIWAKDRICEDKNITLTGIWALSMTPLEECHFVITNNIPNSPFLETFDLSREQIMYEDGAFGRKFKRLKNYALPSGRYATLFIKKTKRE